MDRWPILRAAPGGSHRVSIRPVQVPCDLANSVSCPSSSFVSFAVTGKTRFRVAVAVRNRVCAWLSELSCVPRISRYTHVHRKFIMYLKSCTCTVVYLHDPRRGGVSKFFRCEAPFWHHHEIDGRITPSPPAQKAWIPPRLQASLSAAPSHHCSGLYGHAKSTQPAWLVAS